MARFLRYVVAGLGFTLACAPGQVTPEEYPVARYYAADTTAASAALRRLAKSLDVGLQANVPWKNTTTLNLSSHWNEEHKTFHWPKKVDYKRYMRCPDDPVGKTLKLLSGNLTSPQRSFDLRVQLRAVTPDTVAVQLGASAWEEPENTEDDDWTKCESTGDFESKVLAGLDSLLAAGSTAQ